MKNFEVMDFLVPGIPVGKQRPRVTPHGTYTPAKTKDYERLVGRCYCAKAKVRREDYTCPVKMMITVFVAPPRSMSKSMREKALQNAFAPTKNQISTTSQSRFWMRSMGWRIRMTSKFAISAFASCTAPIPVCV